MTEEPTGSFRTLFFKGDATSSSGRTPSVWLLPNKQRCTIRATTDSDPDAMVENFIDIPLFQWKLFTFNFKNTSNGVIQNLGDELQIESAKAFENGMNISSEHMNSDPITNNPESESKNYTISFFVDEILDIRYSFNCKISISY